MCLRTSVALRCGVSLTPPPKLQRSVASAAPARVAGIMQHHSTCYRTLLSFHIESFVYSTARARPLYTPKGAGEKRAYSLSRPSCIESAPTYTRTSPRKNETFATNRQTRTSLENATVRRAMFLTLCGNGHSRERTLRDRTRLPIWAINYLKEENKQNQYQRNTRESDVQPCKMFLKPCDNGLRNVRSGIVRDDCRFGQLTI